MSLLYELNSKKSDIDGQNIFNTLKNSDSNE